MIFLNSNFTKLEIDAAIDYLKYDKAPGADCIPAELIKSCKSVIADDMKVTRTADNLLILNSLIQRQLTLGKSLFVCSVDFSKAFDMVNRFILFYKLLQLGWSGRVIDNIWNML